MRNALQYYFSVVLGFGLLGASLTGCECGNDGSTKVCSAAHPEYCVKPGADQCSPDWTITISPSGGVIDAQTQIVLAADFSAAPTVDVDTRLFFSVVATDTAENVESVIDQTYFGSFGLIGQGQFLVSARFGCDPVTQPRTTAIFQVPLEGNVVLNPPPGDYREPITVIVEYFPANLRVYADRIGPTGLTTRHANHRIAIPSDGMDYAVQVTALDAYGNLVTSTNGHYSSNPNAPFVSAVAAADALGNLDVISVSYDRAITGTMDPSGLDLFHHIQRSSTEIALYPRGPLPAGVLDLTEHLRAFGALGDVALDPDALLSVQRSVCQCRPPSIFIVSPTFFEHFEFSPPTTVALFSDVPLDPDSFRLNISPVNGGHISGFVLTASDILDQNLDKTQFTIDLSDKGLLMGSSYRIELRARSNHPLDPEGGYVTYITTEFGSYFSPLSVTSANGLFIANHPLQVDVSKGWAWYGRNPLSLFPLDLSVYQSSTIDLTDVSGQSVTASVPAEPAVPVPNPAYRTMTVWPQAGSTVFLRSWADLYFTVWLYDGAPFAFENGNAQIHFDDGRAYSAFRVAIGPDRVDLTLPEGFFSYDATMATLVISFELNHPEFGVVPYATTLTYIVDGAQVRPHMRRNSWSWLGHEDAITSTATVSSAQIVAMYGDMASSVTLAIGSPFTPSVITLSTSGAGAWQIAAPGGDMHGVGADLGPRPTPGVYAAKLYLRDMNDTVQDVFDVPIPIVPPRSFSNSLTTTVDRAVEDNYVLAWTPYADTISASSVLLTRVFADTNVECDGNPPDPVIYTTWPADADEYYLPVANLDPGLYAVCISLVVFPDRVLSIRSDWDRKLFLQVQ